MLFDEEDHAKSHPANKIRYQKPASWPGALEGGKTVDRSGGKQFEPGRNRAKTALGVSWAHYEKGDTDPEGCLKTALLLAFHVRDHPETACQWDQDKANSFLEEIKREKREIYDKMQKEHDTALQKSPSNRE